MIQPRVRLLIVVIDLFGGTGTFCRTLAAGLRRYCPGEFELSLLLLRDRGLGAADRELFDRVEVIGAAVHNDWRRLYETPLHAVRLRSALRRAECDLIFTINTYSNLLVPLLSRRPVVLSVHSNSTQQLGESRFGRIVGLLMRRCYPGRLVVGPAQGVIDDLERRFGATRTRVIMHGVDADRIRELAARPVADRLPSPCIVACGRLTPAKDYPTLLAAFARAREQGLQEDLAIVGGGEEEARLRGMARDLGVSHAVHFLGHRDNPFPYVGQARFFVLSSRWEGFGLAVLEAMALGIPCIATDCPSGPGEILARGEHGLVVRPGDVEGLAGAMLALSRDEALRSRLAQQSELRASQLSVRRMVEAYRELFLAEALKGARSGQ